MSSLESSLKELIDRQKIRDYLPRYARGVNRLDHEPSLFQHATAPTLLTAARSSSRQFAENELLAEPSLRSRAIQYVNAGLASRALRPVIDRTFALTDIVEAHRYLESNTQVGKIVVTVDR